MTDRPISTIKQARDALWHWYAFAEWEDLEDTEAVTDELVEQVEDRAQRLFGAFCAVLGHSHDSYGACVFCREAFESGEQP